MLNFIIKLVTLLIFYFKVYLFIKNVNIDKLVINLIFIISLLVNSFILYNISNKYYYNFNYLLIFIKIEFLENRLFIK